MRGTRLRVFRMAVGAYLMLAVGGGLASAAPDDVLSGEVDELDDLFTQQVEDVRALQAYIETQRQQLAVRDRQITELKQALQEMTDAFERQMGDMARARQAADAAGQEAWQMQLDALAAERDALQKNLDGLTLAQEALQAENEALRADKAALQADKQALLADKTVLQEEKQALRADKAVLQEEKQALRAQAVAQTEQLDAQQAAQAGQIAARVAQVEAEAAERLALAEAAASERASALQQALADLKAETAEEREAAQALRAQVQRLRSDLQAAQLANQRDSFVLAYNAGALYMTAKRYDRAEREFKKALALREEDAPLHYNMGVLYDEHLRKPERARYHYERFLALAPNDRDAPTVMQWLRELP